MPMMLLTLLLAAASGAADAASGAAARGPLPAHLQRLRSAADLPAPTDLESAKWLHAEARARVARIQRHYGHDAPAPLPARAPLVDAAASAIVRPTDFGADPTGATDSSEAFDKALTALLAPRGGPRHTMASNITDLGGATLDLSGGTYLISRPLVIPPGVGNAQIVRGTLRAAPSFPSSRWLVEIGSVSCAPKLPSGKPDTQGSCNEFINLSEIMFDAMHVAAGGVRVAKVMGTTLGPSVFFTGFNQVGVRIDNGHEVMLTEAWLAECYWSSNGPCAKKADSIAVQINGNDHYLTDVIVFDYAHVGVEVNGAANVLQAVHTWNGGGIGMRVTAHQTRMLGCYLDYNFLEVVDPSQLTVTESFFLETHANFTSSGGSKDLTGVYFEGNVYATQGDSIVIDPAFVDGSDTIIANEINGGCQLKLTNARKTVTHALVPSSTFEFDFSDVLLLPEIEEVLYSFTASGKGDAESRFVAHTAEKDGQTVVVHFQQAVKGSVTVEVAQAVNGMRPKGPDGDDENDDHHH